MEQGWVALYRQIQENDLWKETPFSKGQAWVDLIMLTNYQDGVLWVRSIPVPVKRGQCGWSQIRLAKKWGWSRDKVRRFMAYLVSEGQIVQKTIQQGKFLTSLITIVNYEKFNPLDTAGNTADRQQTDSRQGSNKKDKKVKKGNKEPLVSENGGKEPKGFSEFWEVYPLKKSKGAARKVWDRIKPSPALLDRIIKKVKEAKTSKEWTKDNGDYIPHPASWLNAEGWEDEFTPQGFTGKSDGEKRKEQIARLKKGIETKKDVTGRPLTDQEVRDYKSELYRLTKYDNVGKRIGG